MPIFGANFGILAASQGDCESFMQNIETWLNYNKFVGIDYANVAN